MNRFQRFLGDEHRGQIPRRIIEQRKPSQENITAEQQSHAYAQAHQDARRNGMGLTPRRGCR